MLRRTKRGYWEIGTKLPIFHRIKKDYAPGVEYIGIRIKNGPLVVGDWIQVRNQLGGSHIYTIVEVNDNFARGQLLVDDDRDIIMRFHHDNFYPINADRPEWDTNEYKAYRRVIKED